MEVLLRGITLASQGACSETGGTVTCLPGTLADGAGATVSVTVTATSPGNWSNAVKVSADEGDLNKAFMGTDERFKVPDADIDGG